MDTIKIDYHLSHYNTTSLQLVAGINDPKEFARISAIRKASLLAIALEASIITMIGSGELNPDEWGKAIALIAFIKYYQASQIDDQSWLDPNSMYDAVDEDLTA